MACLYAKSCDRSTCHEDDENGCKCRHHSLQVSFNRMIKLQYVANHQYRESEVGRRFHYLNVLCILCIII
jgi:hypothetical protein